MLFVYLAVCLELGFKFYANQIHVLVLDMEGLKSLSGYFYNCVLLENISLSLPVLEIQEIKAYIWEVNYISILDVIRCLSWRIFSHLLL